MWADKLHRIGDQLGRPRQQHLILGIPAEAVQTAPRLGLDHHVDRILAVRPALVGHCTCRQISAEICFFAFHKLRQEICHRLVPAERIEVVVPVHRPPVNRQFLQRRLDDRDARHRQPTQIERIPQVLFRQVVDGHEILCPFYRCSQGELFPYAGRLALAISSRLSGVASL